MRITEIHIAHLSIPLIRPFITAIRQTDCVNDVVIMLKTDKGMIGYGSAASTPAITGDSIESIIKAINEVLGPQLIGRSITDFNHLLTMNDQAIENNSSAKAAIDIALHDLFAQYCSLPLYQLLGGNKNTINSCITISVKKTEDMVNDALAWQQQGFTTLKIKLGLNPADDKHRISAIRQAVGPDITLLVDANQGWSEKDTLIMMHYFKQEQLNITLLEQPVAANNINALKNSKEQKECLIIADESCFSPQDALFLAQKYICDGVNIKLMKSGGLENAQAIYHIAKTAQMRIMVGCMLESPIGIAAIASFAVSKPDILYADLDPLFLIKDNYVLGGAQQQHNYIKLAEKPGLGIEGFTQELKIIGVLR